MEPDDVLAPGNLLDQITRYAPEIIKLADVDIEVLFNEDSSNVALEHWISLAEMIDKRMANYDGFVVIHGTDTMVYSATAVSYALRNLKKPVIFTGAQRPLSRLRSDARLNLIDAVETATLAIEEVLIVFGQQIHRANRAKKISIFSYDAFTSPNYPMVGEIGLNLHVDEKLLFRHTGAYRYDPAFDDSLQVIPVLPQGRADVYFPLLDTEATKAFLMIGFGAGNIPEKRHDRWLEFIKSAGKQGKIVFVGSHSLKGSVDLSLYESGHDVAEAGAVGIKDMTIEAAYVKIMKILASGLSREQMIHQFFQNWAGEISI